MNAGLWPKALCAGFWLRSFSTSLGTGKGSRIKRVVQVPKSLYDTKAKGWVGSNVLKASMRVGEDGGVRHIEGTVRADSCTHFTARKGGFQDYMCSGCSGLPSSRTFMTALKSALGEQPAVLCVDDYDPNVNNSLLTRVHLEHKAGCLARSLHLSEKSLWNAKVHFVKAFRHDFFVKRFL